MWGVSVQQQVFIINIVNTTFITKNYKRLLKITQIYKWQQNMSPTERELIGSVGGLNDNHTYPIAAPNQQLTDMLRHDIPRNL